MAPKPITENTLFYGDNLFILREYIPSESVTRIFIALEVFLNIEIESVG